MKLYSYFRSSAAYRVRIAMALKGLEADLETVDLLAHGPLEDFREQVSPQGLVPALASDDDGLLVQSLAIIEYLEERYPEPALLPADRGARAYVRAIAQLIACDIHPLANLRVLRYLKRELKQDQATIDAWYRHWVVDGLTRLEAFVVANARHGAFIAGTDPTMADCLLVPQLFNARRLECDLSGAVRRSSPSMPDATRSSRSSERIPRPSPTRADRMAGACRESRLRREPYGSSGLRRSHSFLQRQNARRLPDARRLG
ncbi:maleylacetoacetate isomerase [Novosphingobium sp. Gsoil 351]|uniref:maleylacetoacetate isomerase n=1 Tax=Novosphingobium sp. Gsoil 351 TaxID=2675225 RepID=UPI001E41654B|nr:maleylacetoacetate isomerase [Novosphingobium sp. Gsoil 351]